MRYTRLSKYFTTLTQKSVVFSTLITSIMLMVFVADLQFTTEVYIGVLYIIVIMLSLWLPGTKYTFYFAAFCTILASYGYFYSIYNIAANTYFHMTNFINLTMTISAIWITTLIAIYIKNISLALTKSETIHKAILNTSIDPIVVMNLDGVIESVSKTIEKSFGWPAQDMVGKKFIQLLDGSYHDQYAKVLNGGDKIMQSPLIGHTNEAVGLHRMRRTFPCEVSINYIDIPEIDEPFFTAVLRDISIRKAYEQKMGWLSTHDELTKIYNRRFFNEQVDKEWRRLLRTQEYLSLIILDVDFFKNYNDALGHQTGDNCLKMIAGALEQNSHRSTDVVARYGGEEFIVLLPNTNQAGALQVAKNIQETIANLNIPHPNSSVMKKVTVSMGVASIIPTIGASYERLIRFADQALYEAKRQGRNRIQEHKED